MKSLNYGLLIVICGGVISFVYLLQAPANPINATASFLTNFALLWLAGSIYVAGYYLFKFISKKKK
jgi:uncharacterized protein (DUF486 family)